MKARLNLWLSQNARLPGVLACGLQYPDHTHFIQQWAAGFESCQLERLLTGAADVWKLLRLHGIGGRWLRWSHRQGSFYLAQRSDGTALGLLAGPSSPQMEAEQMTALLERFVQGASHG